MMHYYTNRELARLLGINLARWKRWSRSFLPPDPLGGMQSGYARQYTFKDLFLVFFGGHLIGHLKLSVADSQRILADLSPWLKKNGFLKLNINGGKDRKTEETPHRYRVYFSPLGGVDGAGRFRYLIRRSLEERIESSPAGPRILETMEETVLNADSFSRVTIVNDPHVRLINLSAIYTHLVERLDPIRRP